MEINAARARKIELEGLIAEQINQFIKLTGLTLSDVRVGIDGSHLAMNEPVIHVNIEVDL